MKKYVCPKCGGLTSATGEIWVSGNKVSSFFNIRNRRLTTVTCSYCGYTELFDIHITARKDTTDSKTTW